MYPNQQLQNKKQLLIIGTLLSVTVVAVIALTFIHQHKKSPATTASNATTHYDANSGETSRTIKGESNRGVSSDTPTYLGLNALLSRGVSSSQLVNMQTAFYRYKVNSSSTFKQVSISVNSIKTSIVNEGATNQANVINFGVVLDDKTTLQASLQYSGLNSIELFLSDQSGTQIYDSGVVDSSPSSGD